MKLSTLYEARDPKKEAGLEPYLTAPFMNQPERARLGRAKAKAYRQEFGMPDPQFLPDPPKGNEGEGYRYDPNALSPGPYYKRIQDSPKVIVPVQRYGPGNVPPVPNLANPKHLIQAIHYWSKNFNGERWPTLEKAFLNRDFTFQGKIGMYDSARASLFKYLNELKTPWPEGEKMADKVLNSAHGWEILTHYYHKIKAAQDYSLRRPRNPEFIRLMRMALGEASDEGDFHVDDVFDRQANYSTDVLAYFRQYISKEIQLKPKPTPRPRKRHPSDYPEHLRQTPPFAGWA
jgi:hypothetical protein